MNWLKEARKLFDDAVDSVNITLAMAIIEDVRGRGFIRVAKSLNKKLIKFYGKGN